MNVDSLVRRLDRFAEILPAVAAGLPPADARWRPPDGGWSILELVTHPADGEVEDFRWRLGLTRRDPGLAWAPPRPAAPAGPARSHAGASRGAVGRFVAARRESIRWLNGLGDPAWSGAHRHPSGELRGGDLLAAWVAHDAMHLRQISKRFFQLSVRDAGEYVTGYAGSWPRGE